MDDARAWNRGDSGGESGEGEGGGDRTGTLSISIGMRFDRIRARWSARESAVGGARGVMERLTRVSWTLGGPNSIFGAIGTRKDDTTILAQHGIDEASPRREAFAVQRRP